MLGTHKSGLINEIAALLLGVSLHVEVEKLVIRVFAVPSIFGTKWHLLLQGLIDEHEAELVTCDEAVHHSGANFERDDVVVVIHLLNV